MPLLIQVREYDHKYVLTAEYRSDMYSEAFVRGMLESYEAAMDSLLKAKYISEVSVLSRNGADKIAEFNNTACEYDRSKTIADMFEELVQTIPDHTAVVFKDKNILTENWMRSVTDLENISHPRELAVKMLFPF